MTLAQINALAPRRVHPRQPPSARRAHVMQVVLSLVPGGTEHLVIELCRRIQEDYQVTVCCLDDDGAWADTARAVGIEVVALRRPGGFRPRIGRRIAELALTRGVGLLHCHQYSPFVYGRIAAWHHPALRLVYTEHGRLSDAPPSWRRRLVNPYLARFDGAMVAVSNELRDYMSTARFPSRRIKVIHNGIAVAPETSPADRRGARELLGLAEETFAVATVARLDPVKDLPTLLSAFAAVHRRVPQARLIIVGDGPERPALERAAALEHLADAVQFVGFRSDVRALLPGFDLFVNTSISEGVSVTILEALAGGVPVVATAVGGTPEILRDGDSGVLVPVRDPQRLAGAIEGLARDPSRRRTLAAAGRERLVSAFTIERMVGQYVELYEQLLQRSVRTSSLMRSIR